MDQDLTNFNKKRKKPKRTIILHKSTQKKKTEKEVLLTFTKIIQRNNPHIITGYNITGFDFEFMYQRSQELDCVHDFLKLSKIYCPKNHIFF